MDIPRVLRQTVSNNSSQFLNDTSDSDTLRDYPSQYLSTTGTFLSSDDSDEEPTPLVVPKFIQAIVTLILCAILISVTLCLITQLKKLCSNYQKNSAGDVEENTRPLDPIRNNNTSPASPAALEANFKATEIPLNANGIEVINDQNSPVLNPAARRKPDTGSTDKLSRASKFSRTSTRRKRSSTSGSSIRQANAVYLKVPGVQFVRRTSSGPFGDDAMAFVRETYRKPIKPPPSPELGFTGVARGPVPDHNH